jgi:putative membrane protein
LKKSGKPKSYLSSEQKISLGIIVLFHLVGIFLLNFTKGGIYQIALDIVPLNIIFTVLVVLKYQSNWNTGIMIFGALGILSGYFIEVLGVNTGWIFGNYQYGDVLGLKLLNTPLLIGLNWFLITYCLGNLIENFKINKLFRILLSASILVLFDYFMEPIAMKHGFWEWQNGNIPNQNYIGWFFTAIFISAIFQFTTWEKTNKVASFTFLIQLLFFLTQNIL